MPEKLNNILLSRAMLFTGAILSLSWSVYFALVTITIPYQIELREGTALVLTKFLLAGANPFSLENQPLGMNNYGLGYNLAVLPFAYLFGNTLAVHRAVTFFFVLLLSLLIVWTLYKTRKDLPLALVCAAFAMTGTVAQGSIGAFPSAMGTFLFMAAVLIPLIRSFDMTSLVMSIFLSVFAFYTKAYFVLSFGIVAGYLLLSVSLKKALLYILFFLSLFTTSLYLVHLAFPLYFINTIVGNVSNTVRSAEHLLSQFKQLALYFYPVLIVTAVILIMEFRKKDKPPKSEIAKFSLNLTNWSQPLWNSPLNYYLFAFISALLAFTFILGLHIGSYLNYAYQILIPTFFCWFFQIADFSKGKRWPLALIVVLNLFVWQYALLSPDMLKQKESKEWAQIAKYLQTSSSVLNAPVITSAVIELGLNPLDSGQTIYFYSVQPYADNILIGPLYETLKADGAIYTNNIDHSLERKNYDLVVTIKEKASFYSMPLLNKNYSVVDEVIIDMPQTNQHWTVLIWRPKDE
jgi:hypothetical protein